MNESNQPSDPLIGQLQRLQPAKSTMDVRETFYRAGYEACRVQMRSGQSRKLAIGLAAAMIALLVTVPTSYLAGKATASGSGRQDLAQADPIGLQTARSNGHSQNNLRSTSTPTPAVLPDLPTQEDEAAPIRRENAERPDAVELVVNRHNAHPLTSWMNPLASIARSTKLDRQAESMQTTSHASLFVLESAIRNLSELPFSVAQTSQLAMIAENDSSDAEANHSRQTLAVGDLNALAIGLEAAQ